MTDIVELEKELIKKYGDGVIVTAASIIDKPKKVLQVSPAIALGLGGGVYEGSWCGLAGPPGCGKAQPLSSIVYTPSGPIRMTEVTVGQKVCLPNGENGKVLGVYPQGLKDVYEVTFSDGSKTKCCDEHLWKVSSQNGYKSEVLNTKYLRQKLKMNDGKRIYSIQMTQPVEFNKQEHYIHPYLMGTLLSEGGLDGSVKFTTSDKEILDKIKLLVPEGYSVKKKGSKRPYDYSITRDRENGHFNLSESKLTNQLKNFGLYGKQSFEKWIPTEYLIDSVENRLSLIQGLMDGDGTTNKNGYGCSYSTSSKELAENFKFLIQSIGGKCTVGKKETFYTYKNNRLQGKTSYICHISINNMKQLFSLSRKKDRLVEKTQRFTKRYIESIEYVGQEQTQCIMVDSPDHLYLTDEFIVTHNTTLALTIAEEAQKQGRQVFYLNVEARLKKMNVEGIKGLDAKLMKVINYVENRSLTGEDFLKIAEEIIKNIKNSVIIIDSVSTLCPTSEMEADVTGSIRPTTPKMLSHFIKKNVGLVYINNCIIVMIHHQITNTSGYGAKWQISDGVKVNFQADVRLSTKGNPADWKEGDTQIGQIVEWEVCKAGNAGPVSTIKNYIRYGIGIDKIAETFNLGTDFGVIIKAGAWCKCPVLGEDFKTNGQEKFIKHLMDNPKDLEIVQKSLNEMMGVK